MDSLNLNFDVPNNNDLTKIFVKLAPETNMCTAVVIKN